MFIDANVTEEKSQHLERTWKKKDEIKICCNKMNKKRLDQEVDLNVIVVRSIILFFFFFLG